MRATSDQTEPLVVRAINLRLVVEVSGVVRNPAAVIGEGNVAVTKGDTEFAYPIGTFTYAIFPTKSSKAAELRKFGYWAVTQGQKFGPPLLFQHVRDEEQRQHDPDEGEGGKGVELSGRFLPGSDPVRAGGGVPRAREVQARDARGLVASETQQLVVAHPQPVVGRGSARAGATRATSLRPRTRAPVQQRPAPRQHRRAGVVANGQPPPALVLAHRPPLAVGPIPLNSLVAGPIGGRFAGGLA